uniref:Uncharacterized protein n=1 Tax=Dasya naccarioides TaxID=2007180 RepID=A0A1Z1MGK6_9FLOR|nr:hypothetical protein [Dasya naccarioides]ARW65096.1 hypothetical protein [Dasya naccarioides]
MRVKYWPNQQGIELNNATVNLFQKTQRKILKNKNILNKTKYYQYDDLLNDKYKQNLFLIILKEFQKLVLDITELNLTTKNLKKLSTNILEDFINKVYKSFLFTIQNNKNNINRNYTITLDQDLLLIDYLLTYLIFGSSLIDNDLFIFNPFYTPYTHVQILFENFMIQLSNLVIYEIYKNFICLSEFIKFLKQYPICNSKYISYRTIALFFNRITWQKLIKSYIYTPQLLYSAKYEVLIFTSKGIINKYIYALRLKSFKNLSQIENIVLVLLELKDICLPEIKKILITITKYIIYILIKIINNSIILFIRMILLYIYKK